MNVRVCAVENERKCSRATSGRMLTTSHYNIVYSRDKTEKSCESACARAMTGTEYVHRTELYVVLLSTRTAACVLQYDVIGCDADRIIQCNEAALQCW